MEVNKKNGTFVSLLCFVVGIGTTRLAFRLGEEGTIPFARVDILASMVLIVLPYLITRGIKKLHEGDGPYTYSGYLYCAFRGFLLYRLHTTLCGFKPSPEITILLLFAWAIAIKFTIGHIENSRKITNPKYLLT